jgi:hypothetical protein
MAQKVVERDEVGVRQGVEEDEVDGRIELDCGARGQGAGVGDGMRVRREWECYGKGTGRWECVG